MKRIIDIVVSLIMLIVLSPLLLFLVIVIRVDSKGDAIFWSNRVGIYGKIYAMPKFRTMKIETPIVATHLLVNPKDSLTKIGIFLRKFSLDELPQLWSVLIGNMSFVGPRPALFNQYDLISLRKQNGIDKLIPGITGWAQVNGRDELSIEEKVRYELDYLRNQSLLFDFKIILITLIRVVRSAGVSH